MVLRCAATSPSYVHLFRQRGYEERKASQASLFDDGKDKYIRHDAITDFILKRAQGQYGQKVTKEDIFYYVYGFLHCPAYRETFANDLKKMLPRLPLVEKAEDFWTFSHAGRELADLHLGYEQVSPSKEVMVDWHNMLPGIADADTPETLYRVEQMRFGKNGKDKDKSIIEYNPYITLRGIPLRAYDYVVNGKSAIEWIYGALLQQGGQKERYPQRCQPVGTVARPAGSERR